jgi:hypothetical protein
MNRIHSTVIGVLLAFASASAIAQTAPAHRHHHGGSSATPAQQPAAPQGGSAQMPMMQNMPEQCRAAMQNMPQGCMGAMQQMMQQHGAAGGGHGAHHGAQLTEASKAYLEAMDKMHGPMMDGARAPDPDVAFVKGMIPHHEGAIEMARIVLRYGKDEQMKKLANDVIRAAARAAPAGTIYTCPMHPEIRQVGPGSCPICGMALEPERSPPRGRPNPELAT